MSATTPTPEVEVTCSRVRYGLADLGVDYDYTAYIRGNGKSLAEITELNSGIAEHLASCSECGQIDEPIFRRMVCIRLQALRSASVGAHYSSNAKELADRVATLEKIITNREGQITDLEKQIADVQALRDHAEEEECGWKYLADEYEQQAKLILAELDTLFI